MQQELNKLTGVNPLTPFNPLVCSYLNAVSKELLSNPESRLFPDVITFAFWCRKANIDLIKSKTLFDERLGRGIIFHVAPANVPINFAYSLVSGLLSGNINIVRLPTKKFKQVDLICTALTNLLLEDTFSSLKDFVNLIRYDRDTELTAFLSLLCDVRIIWGGDFSINEIRNFKLRPSATDITFYDRYSLCTINAEELIKEENLKDLTRKFFNDSYLFDQNACTSPHLIIWIGDSDKVSQAKKLFWDGVTDTVESLYDLQPIHVINKLLASCRMAILGDSVISSHSNNYVTIIEARELNYDIERYKGSGGFFLEYSSKDLGCLTSLIKSNYQTLSYYGFEKEYLKEVILTSRLKGIDRVVPIGSTLDFSLTWDGYDLIHSLSRHINFL